MNVAFIIHARDDLTARVFEAIRAAAPDRLFVIADGPRNAEEQEKCERTRKITEAINWACQVKRNYSAQNLGCRERIISGLNWVFEDVEECIILEDDCLPHPSFFPFCKELLRRFADDSRVGYISGQNFVGGNYFGKESYGFSKYGGIWGWATWRRAWRLFDKDMESWPESGLAWAHGFFGRKWIAKRWSEIYEDAYRNTLGAWGYNWCYTMQRRNWMAVVPAVNLVLNTGFRADAAHTPTRPAFYSSVTVNAITFPMSHPAGRGVSASFDKAYENKVLGEDAWRRFNLRLRDRHFYGAVIRRIPLLGRAWAAWRESKKTGLHSGAKDKS